MIFAESKTSTKLSEFVHFVWRKKFSKPIFSAAKQIKLILKQKNNLFESSFKKQN
jgi:hypothetical protein